MYIADESVADLGQERPRSESTRPPDRTQAGIARRSLKVALAHFYIALRVEFPASAAARADHFAASIRETMSSTESLVRPIPPTPPGRNSRPRASRFIGRRASAFRVAMVGLLVVAWIVVAPLWHRRGLPRTP